MLKTTYDVVSLSKTCFILLLNDTPLNFQAKSQFPFPDLLIDQNSDHLEMRKNFAFCTRDPACVHSDNRLLQKLKAWAYQQTTVERNSGSARYGILATVLSAGYMTSLFDNIM